MASWQRSAGALTVAGASLAICSLRQRQRSDAAARGVAEAAAAQAASAAELPRHGLSERGFLPEECVPRLPSARYEAWEAVIDELPELNRTGALAAANAEGLSLNTSANAAGYRGVKITKRSRTRPFQANTHSL